MNRLSSFRRSLLRLAMATTLALALLPLSPNIAWACVCDQPAPHEAVRNAAAVFTGVARGRIAPERVGFGERVEFTVETVYKGEVPSRWSVSIEATSCGYVFSDGERYTVFATAAARTNLCMGNVQGAIDPASYGVQPITVYPSQLIDFSRDSDRLALTAFLVVLGLGAVVAIRLRRSRSA